MAVNQLRIICSARPRSSSGCTAIGVLAGTVKFIFQPAEENAEGAAAVIEDGAMQDPKPEAIFAGWEAVREFLDEIRSRADEARARGNVGMPYPA